MKVPESSRRQCFILIILLQNLHTYICIYKLTCCALDFLKLIFINWGKYRILVSRAAVIDKLNWQINLPINFLIYFGLSREMSEMSFPRASLNRLFCQTNSQNPKDTVLAFPEQQQICPFEELQPSNIWHFCLKSCFNII